VIARVITYTVLAALSIFVLATSFLLDRGGSSATPDAEGTVSVHDLSTNPDAYRGETVTTLGTLGLSADTTQYQLVDETLAVVVNGYELDALQSLSGQRVSVTGRFDFADRTGIFIDADVIEVQD
jgi:hypothetical protein